MSVLNISKQSGFKEAVVHYAEHHNCVAITERVYHHMKPTTSGLRRRTLDFVSFSFIALSFALFIIIFRHC